MLLEEIFTKKDGNEILGQILSKLTHIESQLAGIHQQNLGEKYTFEQVAKKIGRDSSTVRRYTNLQPHERNYIKSYKQKGGRVIFGYDLEDYFKRTQVGNIQYEDNKLRIAN